MFTPAGQLYQKVEIFAILGRAPTPVHQLARHFAWPSGPRCPSAMPSFTWIGATSRPCGVKMLIFGLWVNIIPAGCRFKAILSVITQHKSSSSEQHKDTLKKPRLKDRTDRAWFSRLVQHPARKWSGSILTSPDPARGFLLVCLVAELWAVGYVWPGGKWCQPKWHCGIW